MKAIIICVVLLFLLVPAVNAQTLWKDIYVNNSDTGINTTITIGVNDIGSTGFLVIGIVFTLIAILFGFLAVKFDSEEHWVLQILFILSSVFFIIATLGLLINYGTQSYEGLSNITTVLYQLMIIIAVILILYVIINIILTTFRMMTKGEAPTEI